MTPFIRQIAFRLGIDKAIFFTSLARVIQASGGVITVVFVARFLTGVEQGFYYTFGSIAAIQVFFELGLNGIITQYVAHEASHLQWDNRSTSLVGENKYQSRLSSLLHFSVKWYLFFAIFLLIALIITGYLFFNKYDHTGGDVGWKIPWGLLALGTTFNLLLAPIMAFLEGLGKVKEVAKVRLYQQILGLIIVWSSLSIGLKLYVPGINSLIGLTLVTSIISLGKFKEILLNIWNIKITDKVDYKKEIFPYQWKIALSWISGYFMLQLFNPILFATEGAVVAGQMGMTLAALSGIQSLSFSWISTKIPLFSGLIAQKKYKELDTIFNRTLKQSISINGTALFFMFIIIFFIRYFHIVIGNMNLGNRFLDYLPMLLMMIPLFINQFIFSWAIYLRCHKADPYLVMSIVIGILCCLSTLFLSKCLGVMGVTGGYCFITVLSIYWAYYIFKTKKKKWDNEL